MGLFKKYVQACALVTTKHLLYGAGAALCSVSNYMDFALNSICNDINRASTPETPMPPPVKLKDMN